MLLGEDAASWAPWNAYAQELVRDTGARAERIADCGVTGLAFFDRIRRIGRPVLNSPKGQTSVLPPGPVRRPVVAPQVYWSWSLVRRADEERPTVLAVVVALCERIEDRGLRSVEACLPAGDPYRPECRRNG
ncbi:MULTISPECIES: hypothetical protein [unclassified Streptomyces]|uniref:hypothetical protein n=1 Tax=unclassified Streptomyces TaxID=2593676 RepID=UPI00382A31D6